MNSLETWYLIQTKNNSLELNANQLLIIQQLDSFMHTFTQMSWWNIWYKKPKAHGFYIYGTVGNGKTMILNQCYDLFPQPQKLRIHFHEFMYNIHQRLSHISSGNNPLNIIAKELRTQYQIIFLDEMIVGDIATAMILQNLFIYLFEQGIYLIITSNTAPDNLYQQGLQRERFLPAIDLIKSQLTILHMNVSHDYRITPANMSSIFFINDINSTSYLQQLFIKINGKHPQWSNTTIKIQFRLISTVQYGHNIIWFHLNAICGEQRSQNDYLELVAEFRYFILDEVTTITNLEILRRFIFLIDILYDHKCKLALSSSVNIVDICPNNALSNEFKRTFSRLQEMQTQKYFYE